MNPSLLLGIIIGMGAVLFCFGVFLALPARRMKNSNASFNERSLAELIERNDIGQNQLKILSAIDASLVIATEINRKMLNHITSGTPESERKARRERIAVPMMAATMRLSMQCEFRYDTPQEVIEKTTKVAMRYTDQLIAELDKPEP